VNRPTEEIEHHRFAELPRLLLPGDRLVVNDTRVIPVRLTGRRRGASAEIEVLLLRPVEGREGYPTFEALARPARKLVKGTSVFLGLSRVEARIIEEVNERKRLVEFPEGLEMEKFLDREGHMPLPPYIHRDDTREDRERYQTIFARQPGAVAAPTAGLHFTERVLADLDTVGIAVSSVTLDVGLGTFSPVLEEDPRNHVMEREYYRISPEAAEEITTTRRKGGRIVAVGTTVVRTLESAAGDEVDGIWNLTSGENWTEAFIYPPYRFRFVDAMITNFHLPRSTLLMLVSAFAGTELTRTAYREAVSSAYRFYSYGDAMLIV
jgi:S-adenosylmethionine:tRNA ribosyltransferase-isomerase